jgi:small subunit ribosomal protein S17
MSEQTQTAVGNASRRKSREGRVVSNQMAKTVVVSVETVERHPLYGKIMRRSKKYKVHDEENRCVVGDLVRIRETRPLSKDKCWVVEEILRRAEQVPA